MKTYINSLDQNFNLRDLAWCYSTSAEKYEPSIQIVGEVLTNNNFSDVFKTEEEAMYDYLGGAGKRERGFEIVVMSSLRGYPQKTIKKPPTGIEPQYLHVEKRIDEINGALRRLLNVEAGKYNAIPASWVKERNDLIKKLNELKDGQRKD